MEESKLGPTDSQLPGFSAGLGHLWLFLCFFPPNFSKTLGQNKKELRVLPCLDGFPQTSKTPDEGCEETLEFRKDQGPLMM